MSTTPAVDAAVLQKLADGFAGRVLQSSDDDYEGARRVHHCAPQMERSMNFSTGSSSG